MSHTSIAPLKPTFLMPSARRSIPSMPKRYSLSGCSVRQDESSIFVSSMVHCLFAIFFNVVFLPLWMSLIEFFLFLYFLWVHISSDLIQPFKLSAYPIRRPLKDSPAPFVRFGRCSPFFKTPHLQSTSSVTAI